jgi:mannose-6-phosphate isomerase-like protein (cupin superfamily)
MGKVKPQKEFDEHPYSVFMNDQYNAYESYIHSQGIPIVEGSFVKDLRTMQLEHWDRIDGKAALIVFSDQRVCDGYVAEIAPGESLRPQRHLLEEIVLVAQGRGATTIWQEGSGKHSFEWERGSLFSIPLNAHYQHFNTSGSEPVRFISLTSLPPMLELFRDPAFLFDNPHVFEDRFDASDADFFSQPGKYLTEYYGGVLNTNFIADIRKIDLVPRERRGKGNKNMYIHLAGSTMFAHVSKFPVGTYKKAHRHGPGAHVCMLDSTGYTMMWNDGEEPQRYDWEEGSIVSPPAGMWHQHFNTGHEPARFVALHSSYAFRQRGDGSEQIEREDEDQYLRDVYAKACAENGIEVQVD